MQVPSRHATKRLTLAREALRGRLWRSFLGGLRHGPGLDQTDGCSCSRIFRSLENLVEMELPFHIESSSEHEIGLIQRGKLLVV